MSDSIILSGLIVIVWLVVSWIIGLVAQSGGRSGVTAFWLCLLLSPVLGTLVTFLLPPRELPGKRKLRQEWLRQARSKRERKR